MGANAALTLPGNIVFADGSVQTTAYTGESGNVIINNEYTDANVASYISTYTGDITAGNIDAGNISINGNPTVTSDIKRQIWVSSSTPTSGEGTVGDIWYQY